MRFMFLSMLALASSQPVAAQSVAEGVHSDAHGPSTMCGLTGKDAQDLMKQVRVSRTVSNQALNSDRFELYASSDSLIQWVFTKPNEPAYPAVTCRHVYQEKDGSWYQTRNMRCDSVREACDRLFTEFQALDERARQELARKASPSR